jgi:hypothetical protein
VGLGWVALGLGRARNFFWNFHGVLAFPCFLLVYGEVWACRKKNYTGGQNNPPYVTKYVQALCDLINQPDVICASSLSVATSGAQFFFALLGPGPGLSGARADQLFLQNNRSTTRNRILRRVVGIFGHIPCI